MDALKEWYEYVDRVSRPLRRESRLGRGAPSVPSLPRRPGTPRTRAREFVAALVEQHVPAAPEGSLLPSLAPPSQSPVFEPVVPTASIPEFGLMRETAPLTESARFVDRLQEQVLTPLPVEAAAPTVPADEPVEVEHLATSAPAPEPSARVPRHWELLLRLPSCEVAQNSYKIPFRETREDLISRLLDPPLSLEEAARLIGVCPTTVRRYTSRGLLRHYRTVGNQRRFRLSDVLEFLSEKGGNIVEDGRKTKGQRRRTEDE